MASNIAQTSRLGRRLFQQASTINRAFNTSASVAASASKPITEDAEQRSPTVHSLPRVNFEIGPTHQNRYLTYYNNSLSRDLLYMTYDHTLDTRDAASIKARNSRVEREWDPSSPYSKNRPERSNRGNRLLIPSEKKYAEQVVDIDRIVITSFSKDAILNKMALIPLAAMFRAITGKPLIESDADPLVASNRGKHTLPKTGYVRILRAKSNVASFKLRKGMPVGIQAVLPRNSAYEFLEVLSTFVLPRLRNFNGFPLPPASQSANTGAAVAGTVSLGMKPDALSLFPQLEVNWDSYPSRPPGFQIDCITNQRGRGATEKARQLLSGLGIPFTRRGGFM
ncbi:ribosomal protein L5 [Meira miltonrushii]|uniref:Ribosomal protein L5 n=1 Tax=Meira miltonrushii TaxID=1280837 RepID=A0A316VJY4_9BASI|nr:ribosomal protein L5 [Meira miltonrushii]PWN37919.1 ribosomal protein L5 [Meira miltonrushii]